MKRIFITGGTGYMGSRLIPVLLGRGHEVRALARPGSEGKLPPGCTTVSGSALDGSSYENFVASCDTFVHLIGVAHPSPAKAQEFVSVDQKSALEAIRVAAGAGVRHFIYLSVAQPAPMMHSYIEARAGCEKALLASAMGTTGMGTTGMNATILRPWYVLGPGHRWPYVLLPFYWLAERVPSKREAALRLGLVTISQMVNALATAVDRPAEGVRIVEVPEIRDTSV